MSKTSSGGSATLKPGQADPSSSDLPDSLVPAVLRMASLLAQDAELRARLGPAEADAIRKAAERLAPGRDRPPFGQPAGWAPLSSAGTAPVFDALVTRALDAAKPAQVAVGIDFGTAYSKACVRLPGPDLHAYPLDIGRLAAERAGLAGAAPVQDFCLDSLVYFTDDRVVFGPLAQLLCNQDADSRRACYQSIKLQLSDYSLKGLQLRPLTPAINPAPLRFTEYDACLLLIGYMTRVIDEALARYQIEGPVERWFALPLWTPAKDDRYRRSFAHLFARGQVIADTFGGYLHQGLPIATARKVLDEVAKIRTTRLQRVERTLVGAGVHEASAAGAPILRSLGDQRCLCLVVDVGAGTTDYAGLMLDPDPQADAEGAAEDEPQFRLVEVKTTVDSRPYAGNAIDQALYDYVMSQLGLADTHPEALSFAGQLRRQIRETKQDLFRTGFIDIVDRRTGRAVAVDLNGFLGDTALQKIANTIRDVFLESVEALADLAFKHFNGEIHVILTGGGASLPFVQNLTALSLDSLIAPPVKLIRIDGVPGWLGEAEQHFFPQLAVAIGCTLPEMQALARNHALPLRM